VGAPRGGGLQARKKMVRSREETETRNFELDRSISYTKRQAGDGKRQLSVAVVG